MRGSAGKPPLGASGDTGFGAFLRTVAAAAWAASPTASAAFASASSTTGAISVSSRARSFLTLALSFFASAFHSSFVLAMMVPPRGCQLSISATFLRIAGSIPSTFFSIFAAPVNSVTFASTARP